jgi:pyruvate,water dikinase
MPEIFPIGEFTSDEWYPGYRPSYSQAPWCMEPVDTFRPEDESRFWFLDFHWPRGLTPLGFVVMEDCHVWGTQSAAQALPLPPGHGLAARVAGTHVYDSNVPVQSPWEIGFRAERIGRNLPRILAAFEQTWAERRWELEYGFTHFETLKLEGKSPAELTVHLVEARNFHRRCWEIHFEIMYPLLANYLGFYGVCGELGIDPGQIAQFLQGHDTKILACDRGLWELTAAARGAGLEGVFASTDHEGLAAAIAREPGAGPWRNRFDQFLGEYGWRGDGIADPALTPWIEDPTPALGMIKTFLQKESAHDFDAARTSAVAERESAIDEARSKLTAAEQRAFDAGLASCQAANFAWWNEEHNHYIDLRVAIPLRRIALALARTLGADRPDDALYLFWPEILEAGRGTRGWAGVKGVIDERRDYYRYWLERRPGMPKVLGTIPDRVTDPVLLEIFGMHHHFFEGLRANGTDGPVALRGMAASTGVARGRARVLHNASDLHRLQPGEVLVCEATSPNWTPAFTKIAACVCDGGGTLTHASIVSREYRVPCVVGVGRATAAIRTGDDVEVDGTEGVVRVIRGA